MAANGMDRGFMNAASPGVIAFSANDYYPPPALSGGFV